MIRIRPYKNSDEEKILSWCTDEETFIMWTFGILGEYPITSEKFQGTAELMRFTAIDEEEPVGFFTMRNLTDDLKQLRFGYALIKPDRRGEGIAKAMLRLGLDFAFNIYKAERVTLGVVDDNIAGRRCYSAIGFTETGVREAHEVGGVTYTALEMDYVKQP